MLKTTMLVAGLAAAAALDKKQCPPTTTLKNDNLGSAFVCTAARTNNAFCTYTAKTTPTHFGGGIKCVEDKLSGAAAASGCFEFQVVKSCPLLTKAVVEGWGCTQAAAITATDINVDATTKAASYTCTIAATHALYTETAAGVKTYNSNTQVTVNCDHTKGEWTAPKLSTAGICTPPVLSTTDVANKYRLSDTTTVTTGMNLRTDDLTLRDQDTKVTGFKLYSDGKPAGAKVCGLNTGFAIAAATFPRVVMGEYCATQHKRDGSTDNVPHFGAFKCNGASGWELPKAMCEIPKRCFTSATTGVCGTVDGEDAYYTQKLVTAKTNAIATTAAFEGEIFCGTDTEIKAATSKSGLDKFGISNAAASTANPAPITKNYIPPTSADYRCFFDKATQSAVTYGYAEVKCSGGTALTKTNLPTATQICATGVLDTSPTASVKLDFTGVKTDGTASYKTGSITTTILQQTKDGAIFKINDMGTGTTSVQDTTGAMVSTTRHITLAGCQCKASGKYTCSSTENGCLARTATFTTTVGGLAATCTATELPASYSGQEKTCAASGEILGSTVKCTGGSWVGATGGGTRCTANTTAAAQKTTAETNRGFSWNCAVQTTAGKCTSNVVPTDGRLTCAKARWAPGYLTCSLLDGKWSIQDDYSKCEGSSGYELSEAVRNAHNFQSYSITATPGSVATVVCKAGFGTLTVKDAAGADTFIQKGSGKCANDNTGVTTFVPCLKSCNVSNVANDLNGTENTKGTIDVAGTDCAGLKVWNNNSGGTYQYNCNTKPADKYNGGRVYCDGKTGKFAVGEVGTLKKCSITAGLEKGQVGALCAAGGATAKGTSYLDVACTALGLVAVDGKEVDKESAVYKVAYDCTGVTADGAKCTISANETNFDMSATCCTTNACLDDAKCYQPGLDTRDRTQGCWNFKVDEKQSGASMIGAGIVTLLALFHL